MRFNYRIRPFLSIAHRIITVFIAICSANKLNKNISLENASEPTVSYGACEVTFVGFLFFSTGVISLSNGREQR